MPDGKYNGHTFASGWTVENGTCWMTPTIVLSLTEFKSLFAVSVRILDKFKLFFLLWRQLSRKNFC